MRTPFLGALTALGALALTGCGGDDPSPAAAPAAPVSRPPSLALDGDWLGETDVDQVAMVVKDGTVRLASQRPDGGGRQACEGLLKADTLLLRCTDPDDTTRTRGTVELNDGDRVAVVWSSGRTDLLTRGGDSDGRIDLSAWGR
ncbi:hypothetical protein AB0D49_26815 [Streptomyces sp. NPDC048290]|uniref:hypothetical protein n=1 Tax=Streptomyces sp. NPDC048290 TaxID=3155811 RepID=UPI003434425F